MLVWMPTVFSAVIYFSCGYAPCPIRFFEKIFYCPMPPKIFTSHSKYFKQIRKSILCRMPESQSNKITSIVFIFCKPSVNRLSDLCCTISHNPRGTNRTKQRSCTSANSVVIRPQCFRIAFQVNNCRPGCFMAFAII